MSERTFSRVLNVAICIAVILLSFVLGARAMKRWQDDYYHGEMSEREAKVPLSNYWVICDDGWVMWGKDTVSDRSKEVLCGEHGGKDPRQIHTNSTLGHDWKVIVTPINGPMDMSQEWQAAPAPKIKGRGK